MNSVPYIGNVPFSLLARTGPLAGVALSLIVIISGDGLNKIRSKEWSEPLGVGLKVTGEIFQMAGEAGLPVIGLIGNPEY